MNNKLKPCPFCGGEAKINVLFLPNSKKWKIVHSCVIKEPICYFGSEREAVEAWNRRVKNETN